MQVSSALLCLRQRNTYQGSSQNMLLKAMGSLNDPGSHSSSCVCSTCRIHEPGSNVAEIVESSRIRAQKMVDIAMQVSNSIYFYTWCVLCICLQLVQCDLILLPEAPPTES